MVERKDRVDLFAICQVNQCCIGQLGANSLISFHHRSNAFALGSRKGEKLEESAIDTAQQLLNDAR